MFSGIVREVGIVVTATEAAGGRSLVVRAPVTAAGSAVGDSVALAGCCLTATAVVGDELSFHAVPETIARTTLGALAAEDGVNVEPALRAGDPLGGHYVQGHVDGVGHVGSVEADGEGRRVAVAAPDDVLRYCVEKGSVTVDGVSLTVAALDDGAFAVSLVPHTLAVTTLGRLERGQAVNLEVDVLAKYVERLLGRNPPRASI
jgi:riboflavin synthase